MEQTQPAALSLPDRDGLRAPFAMLHHVAVVTNDMAKTVAFYRDVLGSEIAMAHRLSREDAPRHYFITMAPNCVFAFFEFSESTMPEFREATVRKSGRSLDHVCFFVPTADDLVAWHDKLTRADPRLCPWRHPLLPRPQQHHHPDQRCPTQRRDGLPGA